MNELIESIKNNKYQLLWGSLDNEEDKELLFELDLDKLPELMNKEKERLGIPKEQLVFIGMKNLADYYWCAWQYYQKTKREESNFFLVYLTDRIKFAKKFKLVEKYPKINILEIGDKIKSSNIQEYIAKLQKNWNEYTDKNSKSFDEKINVTVEIDGEIIEEYNLKPNEITAETNHLRKGKIYQATKAEQYPSIRWNYRYKDLILIGIPDGITTEFVYEFKSTKSEKYVKHTLITASCQADIYGVYFERSKRKVQIYCEETDKIYTFEDPIDKKKVIDLLEKWIDMINGKLPIKPQYWKCKCCEFKDDCILIEK